MSVCGRSNVTKMWEELERGVYVCVWEELERLGVCVKSSVCVCVCRGM